MSKEEAIAAIKLLSALESWILSQTARVPDYLHEDLCRCVEVLERVLLDKSVALPDAITDDSENPDYRTGWNDCIEVARGMVK